MGMGQMRKKELLLFCGVEELMIICFISIACRFHGCPFYLFYNILYGVFASVLCPLYVLFREKQDLGAAGVKQVGSRQVLVLAAFVLFSIGGQLVPKIAVGETIQWSVLPVAVLPLTMTTFFEEFLFRGFLQTRIERQFGPAFAVFLSGLLFSLYHLGYPGFRTWDDLLLLFAVGIGFALAFQLSDGNLIVSYFVNLPNAFVTYVFKSEQFPKMTGESAIYAGVTVLVLGFILCAWNRYIKAPACAGGN